MVYKRSFWDTTSLQHTTKLKMKVLVTVVIVLAVAAEAELSTKTDKDEIQEHTVERKSDFSDLFESIAAANVAAPYPALDRLTRKLTCLTKEMNAVRACEQLLVKQGHCLYGPYRDCKEAYDNGHHKSGVYTLNPNGQGTFQAYCNMDVDGGGWTVFQRRKDGSVNFYRNWKDYVTGFGDLNGEHWLGLEKINQLTAAGKTTLRVDLEDYSGNKVFAKYNSFKVGNAASKYTLHVTGYSGNAGDSLSYHNGKKFTTKDSDNDRHKKANCAMWSKGAWWYNSCFRSNLNGLYSKTQRTGYQYNDWYFWKKVYVSTKFDEMKLKRQ